MHKLLVDTCAIVHVDDLLVRGKDQAEHNANVLQILKRLGEMGMHINQEKVKVGCRICCS